MINLQMNSISRSSQNLREEKFILFLKKIFGLLIYLGKYNKGIKHLLCALDLISNYASVVPRGVTIVNAFQKILSSSNMG